jgi:hypothetical protein
MAPTYLEIGLSIAFGLTCGALVWVLYPPVHRFVQRRRGRRPYDWRKDGEADNRSHPRILAQDPYFDEDEDRARHLFPWRRG